MSLEHIAITVKQIRECVRHPYEKKVLETATFEPPSLDRGGNARKATVGRIASVGRVNSQPSELGDLVIQGLRKRAGRTLAARGKSHAGGVTRPGADCLTPGRSRNAASRSPRSPSGDGRLRSSALSFVGGDHPDRHPPHSAPSGRRSPPRLPRDFSHGLLNRRIRDTI